MTDIFGIRIPGTSIVGVPDPSPAQVLPAPAVTGVVGLFEPGHPKSGKTLVPATGESFADIAGEWTKHTLGVTTAPGFQVTNTIVSGNQAFVERTPKGGLHVISAHSGATTPYQNYLISLLAARQSYISTRVAAGDTFYVSYWGRITRPPKSGYTSGVATVAVRKGSNLSDMLAAAGTASGQPWVWPQSGGTGFVGGYTSKNGTAHFSASAGKLATLAAFNQTINAIALGARDAGSLNNLPSELIYRGYIENLTATGRTFAAVREADYREYTDEVLTPGGRYFGDTWTEPTSRVP